MTTSLLQDPPVRPAVELPPLLLIGVDHRSASIGIREKVAYGPEDGRELLRRLVAAEEIAEAYLLITCNRTEVYLVPAPGPAGREAAAYRRGLEAVFVERAPEIESEGRFYVKRQQPAARHLLEVASGLRSMVLGEPEILGQVKRAAAWAESAGAAGPVIRRLVRIAAAAGGRARSETRIGAGAVSFGYAVVDLAQNLFDGFEDCSVLLVGAGETARRVARNLSRRGLRELVVTNRSRSRAEELRDLFPGARAVPFAERQPAVAGCDVIVSSAAAGAPIFTRRDLAEAMGRRRDRPLLVADLGVPRNVEPSAAELSGVYLHDVDSLEELISRNLSKRRRAVPRVHEIVDRELGRFVSWYRGRAGEPLIARLQRRAEEIRRRSLEDARARFPAETHPHLERLTRSLVRRLLHHPTSRLAALDPSDLDRLDLVRDLFQLDGEED